MLIWILQIISLFVCIACGAVFFCISMERRFSVKATVFGTAVFWLFICAMKLPAMLTLNVAIVQAANMAAVFAYPVFNICMFRGTPSRRVLVIALVFVHQIAAELVTSRLAWGITGALNILEPDSAYMIFGSVLILPFYLLFLGLLVWLWRQVARVEWSLGGGQWPCALFPASQFILLWSYLQWSTRNASISSLTMCAALIVSVLGDFYMIVLFYRRGRRLRAEAELEKLRRQRERDRLYYEELLKKERELARLRHDFQNYLLVLQSAAAEPRDEAVCAVRELRGELAARLKQ